LIKFNKIIKTVKTPSELKYEARIKNYLIKFEILGIYILNPILPNKGYLPYF